MTEVFLFLYVIGASVGLAVYFSYKSYKDCLYKKYGKYYGLVNCSSDEIRKFFKIYPEKYAAAEKRQIEELKSMDIFNEKNKIEYIKRRVFAYDYEDMLFQIFAPYAKESHLREWYVGFIPTEEIIKGISQIKSISQNEANEILNLLIKHELIIPNVFEESKECYLSNLLQVYDHNEHNLYERYDIITELDMNLDKWMVAHGYEHIKN